MVKEIIFIIKKKQYIKVIGKTEGSRVQVNW